jgi:hypothetical protein
MIRRQEASSLLPPAFSLFSLFFMACERGHLAAHHRRGIKGR